MSDYAELHGQEWRCKRCGHVFKASGNGAYHAKKHQESLPCKNEPAGRSKKARRSVRDLPLITMRPTTPVSKAAKVRGQTTG